MLFIIVALLCYFWRMMMFAQMMAAFDTPQ